MNYEKDGKKVELKLLHLNITTKNAHCKVGEYYDFCYK